MINKSHFVEHIANTSTSTRISFVAPKVMNGLINFTEFVSAMLDYDKFVKKEQLLECFRSYHTDGSWKISFEEFCDMIKPVLFILYKKFDTNNDWEIDFEELIVKFNFLI